MAGTFLLVEKNILLGGKTVFENTSRFQIHDTWHPSDGQGYALSLILSSNLSPVQVGWIIQSLTLLNLLIRYMVSEDFRCLNSFSLNFLKSLPTVRASSCLELVSLLQDSGPQDCHNKNWFINYLHPNYKHLMIVIMMTYDSYLEVLLVAWPKTYL